MDKANTSNDKGTPRWQGRVACLLLAAVAVYYIAMFLLNACGYFDLREFAGTDTSFFRYFGRRMAEGDTLYTDLWDTKGPMVYLTYYWGMLWDLEAAILLYSLVATWCAYRAFRCVAGALPAAAGVVLMSLTVGFIGWCGTTTESTYTLWALMGLALTLPAQGGGGRFCWRWAAAGALVALCVLNKANYAGFGCFLLAYWTCRGSFLRAAVASAAGFFTVLGGFALTMWAKGNLGGMVDATVMFNLHEYHAAAPAWADFSTLPNPVGGILTLAASEFQYAKHFLNAYTWMALLLVGAVAVLWWRRKEASTHPGLFPALLVWVAVEFLTGGIKFLIYDHYYETLFLPICLLALQAAASLPAGRTHAVAAGGVLLVAAVTSGPWCYFRLLAPDIAQQVEHMEATIHRHALECQTVAVIGGADVLHALNRLGLHSEQRYAHCALMLDYELTPARRAELLAELEAALAQAPVLLAEEPLPGLIARHPELAPLLRGWRAVDETPGNRVFLYLPPTGE